MSFKVQPIEGDAWKLVFFNEPSYVHALPMAPEAIEPELFSGLWLVVVFPVWSVAVRGSVLAAISCAKEHGGKFQLGVRPFDAHAELSKWWPASEPPTAARAKLVVRDDGPWREIHISTDPSSVPMWLVLREGQVIYQGSGLRSQEQLSEVMRAAEAPAS